MRGATVFDAASWARSASAPSPSRTPTGTGALPDEGNATAIATDIRIGKMNAQKSASGSRKISRSRAMRQLDERMGRAASAHLTPPAGAAR